MPQRGKYDQFICPGRVARGRGVAKVRFVTCPSLIVTTSFDPPHAGAQKQMAKILVSSFLRTFFGGQVLVFRNGTPLFLVPRVAVTELEVDESALPTTDGDWLGPALFVLAGAIPAAEHDKVLLLPPGAMAVRNVDHLLEGDWDLGFAKVGGSHGTDQPLGGVYAIRGSCFSAVMARWSELHWAAAPGLRLEEAWFSLLRSGEFKTRAFERGEVMHPVTATPNFLDYREAALLSVNAGSDTARAELMFGLFMRTFFWEPTGSFFHALEI